MPFDACIKVPFIPGPMEHFLRRLLVLNIHVDSRNSLMSSYWNELAAVSVAFKGAPIYSNLHMVRRKRIK